MDSNVNVNSSGTPPTLEDIFQDLHAASNNAAPPLYETYAHRLRQLVPTGTRMLTPLLLIAAMVIVMGTAGVYAVRTLRQPLDMQMSAINSVQAAPIVAAPAIVETVRVGYGGSTAVGQAAPAEQATVYEWRRTETGELRFLWADTWHCAPYQYDIPALWKLSYDIETKPEIRSFYLCEGG